MDLKLKSNPQRKKSELFLDDEPIFDFPWAIYGKKIQLPKASSKEALMQELTVLQQKAAYHFCLKKLSKRAYHSKELEKKLRDLGVDPKDVLEKVHASGFLDDEEFISSFIRVQSGRKVGPRKIQEKLRQKGIVIEMPSLDVRKTIEKLLQKKELSTYQGRQKAIQALMRKGFSYESIQEAMTDESKTDGPFYL